MRALLLVATFALACSKPPFAAKSHEERFRAETAAFERLRTLIETEPICANVWSDHYEWVEACNAGPCTDARAIRTGQPAGNKPARCEWPIGCGRWVDDTPTPELLASICVMPVARATEYLDLMKRTGVLRAHRTFDEVSFPVEFGGIVTSGSTTSIVYRATPPSSLRTGTEAKGSEWRALAPQWWLVREWN